MAGPIRLEAWPPRGLQTHARRWEEVHRAQPSSVPSSYVMRANSFGNAYQDTRASEHHWKLSDPASEGSGRVQRINENLPVHGGHERQRVEVTMRRLREQEGNPHALPDKP